MSAQACMKRSCSGARGAAVPFLWCLPPRAAGEEVAIAGRARLGAR